MVRKFRNIFMTLKSLYCLALGQNSNLDQVEAYKSFLAASGKQYMHTVGRHTTPTENGNIIRICESPARHGTPGFSEEGVSVTSRLKN